MWEYRAALIEVIDADTLRLEIDQGLHGRQAEDIRLLGVGAPEEDDPGGPECTAWTIHWLDELEDLRWPLHVVTSPNRNPEPEERRSFVRYLGTVRDIYDGRCLNDDLRHFLAQHPEWGKGM